MLLGEVDDYKNGYGLVVIKKARKINAVPIKAWTADPLLILLKFSLF